jgi:UTP--glucose-1-phosphate uridylyltransferase
MNMQFAKIKNFIRPKKVSKAIFPVAGFGTRFLPATKAQPKEMLPVVDKPVIQYLVEDAAAAGIKDVIFITGRGKRAIEDHFDYSFELDKTLVEKNKLDLVKTVRRVAELARFSYVRQSMPLGDGHAIACAAHLVNDEPALVVFGDTLFDAALSPIKQVLAAYNKYQAPIIGLAQVARSEVSKFGVIDGEVVADGLYKIKKFIEKPAVEEAPSDLVAVGVYVITPRVLEVLAGMSSGKSGEIHLADAFGLMLAQGETIYGLKLAGEWLDTGSKFGLLKANITLGLKNEEVQDDLKKFLKNLKY